VRGSSAASALRRRSSSRILAFAGQAGIINGAKMANLLASLTAGTVGFLWLKLLGQPVGIDFAGLRVD
jgi:hypothetical protein